MAMHYNKNLALAGVLAVFAAVLTMVYVGSAGAHAKSAHGPLTTIYVATRDIQAGTPGSDAARSIKTVEVPASSVQPDAVTSAAQLRGLVSIQPVYRGEQVSLRRFAELSAQGVLAELHGRSRAVAVSGDATQLLAGTLHPGDHVDVVASLKDPTNQQRVYVRTVLRNIVVLDSSSTTGGGLGSQSAYSATLRVSDAQARTLFYVVKNADWSLVLRPVVHPGDSADQTTSFATLMGGGQ
jgi:pilus assembly protein CpaB